MIHLTGTVTVHPHPISRTLNCRGFRLTLFRPIQPNPGWLFLNSVSTRPLPAIHRILVIIYIFSFAFEVVFLLVAFNEDFGHIGYVDALVVQEYAEVI